MSSGGYWWNGWWGGSTTTIPGAATVFETASKFSLGGTNVYHAAALPTITTQYGDSGSGYYGGMGWTGTNGWNGWNGGWGYQSYPTTATASREYRVADAPIETIAVEPFFRGVEGRRLGDLLLATFADQNPFHDDASQFQASIDWGDGHSEAAAIQPVGDGTFRILGGHKYESGGRFPILIRLTGTDASMTVVFESEARIDGPDAEAPVPLAAPPATWAAFDTGHLVLGKFVDENGSADRYRVKIDWGDGTGEDRTGFVRAVPESQPRTFEIVGRHTFPASAAGQRTATITVGTGIAGLQTSDLFWPESVRHCS